MFLGQPSGGLGGGLFSTGLGQSSGLGFSGKKKKKNYVNFFIIIWSDLKITYTLKSVEIEPFYNETLL